MADFITVDKSKYPINNGTDTKNFRNRKPYKKMIDTDKAVAVAGGAVFTVGGSHSIFTQTITDAPWYLIQITGSQFAFEMMFKIFAAIILAIVGGVFGLLGKDVYLYIIKPKIKAFKNKKIIKI